MFTALRRTCRFTQHPCPPLVLAAKLKRVRAGVKANYGNDSSQYEMVGGTRKSECKPATRKTPPSGS